MSISIAVVRDPKAFTNPFTISVDGVVVATWRIEKLLDAFVQGGDSLIALHLTNAIALAAPHALVQESEIVTTLSILLRMIRRCREGDLYYDGE